MAAQVDPVCGMEVDQNKAAGTSHYKGQEYYFCSAGCKAKFDQNPEQFVGGQQRGQGQSQSGGAKR